MRASLEVADVFRRHGAAYRHAHEGHLGRVERKIMGAIEACRTAALGGHLEHCVDCGLIRKRSAATLAGGQWFQPAAAGCHSQGVS